MLTYPKYRDSDLDWILRVPEHWENSRIRFVAELNPSKSEIATLDRTTVVSFLPMEAIGDDGRLDLQRERPIAEVESGFTYFRDGDVTIAKITPCYENGKGAYMTGLKSGIGFGTTELIVIRPRVERLNAHYLQYLATSSEFRDIGESQMYGAGGQKRVPDSFVRNFELAVPPIDEQKRIVSFLDRETAKIDALIAEQERLMDLLKEKRQAVISHAVTKGLNPDAPMKDSGVEWLGEVPAHWTLSRIKALCSVISKGTTPTTIGADFVTEGIRFLKAENITEDGISSEPEFFVTAEAHATLSRSSLIQGDILVVIAGATTGKSAVLNEDLVPANTNQAVSFLRPLDRSMSRYIQLWLQTDGIRNLVSLGAVQSAQPNLSMEDLGNLPILLPPTPEIERALEHLSKALQGIDRLVADTGSAIALLSERRTALISAAVTGQIDVRHLANADAA